MGIYSTYIYIYVVSNGDICAMIDHDWPIWLNICRLSSSGKSWDGNAWCKLMVNSKCPWILSKSDGRIRFVMIYLQPKLEIRVDSNENVDRSNKKGQKKTHTSYEDCGGNVTVIPRKITRIFEIKKPMATIQGHLGTKNHPKSWLVQRASIRVINQPLVIPGDSCTRDYQLSFQNPGSGVDDNP